MMSLTGSLEELSLGGNRSIAFLKFRPPPDCSMTNVG